MNYMMIPFVGIFAIAYIFIFYMYSQEQKALKRLKEISPDIYNKCLGMFGRANKHFYDFIKNPTIEDDLINEISSKYRFFVYHKFTNSTFILIMISILLIFIIINFL